tara:strand:+ start:6126 stop:7505 length:1380 start_codon:yes stop_codon:yes gene_type:complete
MEVKEYSQELQKLYLEFMMNDHELFVRVNNIVKPEYFDRPLRSTVEFIQEHASEYGAMPTHEQVKAITNMELQNIGETGSAHKDWFLDDFETFCRHKGLEGAILASTDMLDKSEYGAVEHLVKEAVAISLNKNLGTDYWADPKSRLQAIKDAKGGTSTGWKSIDEKLYGGFNNGELNIFAGGSGAGKSIFLQNLALNWTGQGFNTLYVSLELSEELCSMRLDAMLTGMTTRNVLKSADDVELKVKMAAKHNAGLQIVQLPNGITVNDLRSFIKEFEVQSGKKIDAILVDYLDLMMPAQKKVPPSDLFIKDKFVSEELRNFAVEGNYLFATASQLNRSAVEEIEFDHSHIAGGLSKIQTADNVIGIFSSKAMRERGRIQIQFMKTRSSNGVGQKIDLEFNIDSMRITDLDEQESEDTSFNNIYDQLKKKSTLVNNSPQPETTDNAVNSSDRLRSILKKAE